MAYTLVRASSQYITATLASAQGTPCTFVAWAKTTNTIDAQIIVYNGTTAAPQSRRQMYFNSSGQFLNVDDITATGSGSLNSSNTYTSGQYSHAAAIFTSNTSRTAALNGTVATANTTSVGTPTHTSFAIGARDSGTFGAFMDGQVAEVALWTVDLTNDEITSLSKGFSPRRIRPQSLVFYAPLLRNLQDIKGALTLTNNNSATVADHPRVY